MLEYDDVTVFVDFVDNQYWQHVCKNDVICYSYISNDDLRLRGSEVCGPLGVRFDNQTVKFNHVVFSDRAKCRILMTAGVL